MRSGEEVKRKTNISPHFPKWQFTVERQKWLLVRFCERILLFSLRKEKYITLSPPQKFSLTQKGARTPSPGESKRQSYPQNSLFLHHKKILKGITQTHIQENPTKNQILTFSSSFTQQRSAEEDGRTEVSVIFPGNMESISQYGKSFPFHVMGVSLNPFLLMGMQWKSSRRIIQTAQGDGRTATWERVYVLPEAISYSSLLQYCRGVGDFLYEKFKFKLEV